MKRSETQKWGIKNGMVVCPQTKEAYKIRHFVSNNFLGCVTGSVVIFFKNKKQYFMWAR